MNKVRHNLLQLPILSLSTDRVQDTESRGTQTTMVGNFIGPPTVKSLPLLLKLEPVQLYGYPVSSPVQIIREPICLEFVFSSQKSSILSKP